MNAFRFINEVPEGQATSATAGMYPSLAADPYAMDPYSSHRVHAGINTNKTTYRDAPCNEQGEDLQDTLHQPTDHEGSEELSFWMQVPDEDLPDLDPNFDFDKALIALGVGQAPMNYRKPFNVDAIYSENADSPSSAPSLSPVLPSYSPSSAPSRPPTEASSPSAPLAAPSAMSQDDSRLSCDISANIAPIMSESTDDAMDALQPKRKVIRRQYGSACDFCHKRKLRCVSTETGSCVRCDKFAKRKPEKNHVCQRTWEVTPQGRPVGIMNGYGKSSQKRKEKQEAKARGVLTPAQRRKKEANTARARNICKARGETGCESQGVEGQQKA